LFNPHSADSCASEAIIVFFRVTEHGFVASGTAIIRMKLPRSVGAYMELRGAGLATKGMA
jgi:hypothetical protein